MANLVQKATDFYNAGDYEESLKLFEQALKEAPESQHSAIHSNVGAVLMGMGELYAAVSAFDEAIALNSSNIESFLNKGVALSALQSYDEALFCFEKVCLMSPNFFAGQCGRSETLACLGRYSEAVVAAEKAVEIEPDNPLGHADLAFALLKSKRFHEANESYDECMKLGDKSDETIRLFSIGLSQEGLECELNGKREESLKLLHRANDLHPTPQNLYNEGITLVTLDRSEEAIPVLQASAKMDAYYFEPLAVLGALYAQREKLPEAQALLTQACELEPSMIEPRFNLGVVKIKRGEIDGAKNEWKTILQLDPEEPHATEALRLLETALDQAKKNGTDGKMEMKTAAKKIAELNPSLSSSNQNTPAPHLIRDSSGKLYGMSIADSDQLLQRLDRMNSVSDSERIDPVGDANVAASSAKQAAKLCAKMLGHSNNPRSDEAAIHAANAAAAAANAAGVAAMTALSTDSPVLVAELAVAAASAAENAAIASSLAVQLDPETAGLAFDAAEAAKTAAVNAKDALAKARARSSSDPAIRKYLDEAELAVKSALNESNLSLLDTFRARGANAKNDAVAAREAALNCRNVGGVPGDFENIEAADDALNAAAIAAQSADQCGTAARSSALEFPSISLDLAKLAAEAASACAEAVVEGVKCDPGIADIAMTAASSAVFAAVAARTACAMIGKTSKGKDQKMFDEAKTIEKLADQARQQASDAVKACGVAKENPVYTKNVELKTIVAKEASDNAKEAAKNCVNPPEGKKTEVARKAAQAAVTAANVAYATAESALAAKDSPKASLDLASAAAGTVSGSAEAVIAAVKCDSDVASEVYDAAEDASAAAISARIAASAASKTDPTLSNASEVEKLAEKAFKDASNAINVAASAIASNATFDSSLAKELALKPTGNANETVDAASTAAISARNTADAAVRNATAQPKLAVELATSAANAAADSAEAATIAVKSDPETADRAYAAADDATYAAIQARTAAKDAMKCANGDQTLISSAKGAEKSSERALKAAMEATKEASKARALNANNLAIRTREAAISCAKVGGSPGDSNNLEVAQYTIKIANLASISAASAGSAALACSKENIDLSPTLSLATGNVVNAITEAILAATKCDPESVEEPYFILENCLAATKSGQFASKNVGKKSKDSTILKNAKAAEELCDQALKNVTEALRVVSLGKGASATALGTVAKKAAVMVNEIKSDDPRRFIMAEETAIAAATAASSARSAADAALTAADESPLLACQLATSAADAASDSAKAAIAAVKCDPKTATICYGAADDAIYASISASTAAKNAAKVAKGDQAILSASKAAQDSAERARKVGGEAIIAASSASGDNCKLAAKVCREMTQDCINNGNSGAQSINCAMKAVRAAEFASECVTAASAAALSASKDLPPSVSIGLTIAIADSSNAISDTAIACVKCDSNQSDSAYFVIEEAKSASMKAREAIKCLMKKQLLNLTNKEKEEAKTAEDACVKAIENAEKAIGIVALSRGEKAKATGAAAMKAAKECTVGGNTQQNAESAAQMAILAAASAGAAAEAALASDDPMVSCQLAMSAANAAADSAETACAAVKCDPSCADLAYAAADDATYAAIAARSAATNAANNGVRNPKVLEISKQTKDAADRALKSAGNAIEAASIAQGINANNAAKLAKEATIKCAATTLSDPSSKEISKTTINSSSAASTAATSSASAALAIVKESPKVSISCSLSASNAVIAAIEAAQAVLKLNLLQAEELFDCCENCVIAATNARNAARNIVKCNNDTGIKKQALEAEQVAEKAIRIAAEGVNLVARGKGEIAKDAGSQAREVIGTANDSSGFASNVVNAAVKAGAAANSVGKAALASSENSPKFACELATAAANAAVNAAEAAIVAVKSDPLTADQAYGAADDSAYAAISAKSAARNAYNAAKGDQEIISSAKAAEVASDRAKQAAMEAAKVASIARGENANQAAKEAKDAAISCGKSDNAEFVIKAARKASNFAILAAQAAIGNAKESPRIAIELANATANAVSSSSDAIQAGLKNNPSLADHALIAAEEAVQASEIGRQAAINAQKHVKNDASLFKDAQIAQQACEKSHQDAIQATKSINLAQTTPSYENASMNKVLLANNDANVAKLAAQACNSNKTSELAVAASVAAFQAATSANNAANAAITLAQSTNKKGAIELSLSSSNAVHASIEAIIASIKVDSKTIPLCSQAAEIAMSAAVSAKTAAQNVVNQKEKVDANVIGLAKNAEDSAEKALKESSGALKALSVAKGTALYETSSLAKATAANVAASHAREATLVCSRNSTTISIGGANNVQNVAKAARALKAASNAANNSRLAANSALSNATNSPRIAAELAWASANAASSASEAILSSVQCDPECASQAYQIASFASSAAVLARSAANNAIKNCSEENLVVLESCKNAEKKAEQAIKIASKALSTCSILKETPIFITVREKLKPIGELQERRQATASVTNSNHQRQVPFSINILRKTGRLDALGGGAQLKKENGFSSLESKLSGAVRKADDDFTSKYVITSSKLLEKPKIVYKTPGGQNTFPYSELKSPNCPSGVDPTKKEEYLSEDEFKKIFNKSREEFMKYPGWRRTLEKRAKNIF